VTEILDQTQYVTSEVKHQVPGCLRLRLLESRILSEAPFTCMKYYTSQANLLPLVRVVSHQPVQYAGRSLSAHCMAQNPFLRVERSGSLSKNRPQQSRSLLSSLPV